MALENTFGIVTGDEGHIAIIQAIDKANVTAQLLVMETGEGAI